MNLNKKSRVTFVKGLCMAALAVCMSDTSHAGLLVKDPIMTSGTGAYTAGSSLAGLDATNSTIGVSGAWGTGTGVFFADATGLAYPAGVLLTGVGGSLSVNNAATSITDCRILTRTMTGLPTSGTLYYSALLRAGTGFTTAFPTGHAVGVGIGTNALSGTLSGFTPPSDGIYFAFQNTGGTKLLVGRVKGVPQVLVTSPLEDQTYLCVAKIELGAGPSGQDIVSLSVDPASPEDFDIVTTNTVLASGATFTKMSIAGSYATGSKKAYFDELRVGTTWEDVAPMADESYPVFNNAPSVSVDGNNDFEFAATLDQGAANTAVIACYGTTQGGATIASWTLNKLVTDTPTLGVSATTTLDNLSTNTSYYYGVLGTNANYSVLKNGSTFLVGEVWLTAGQDAQEEGLVSGTMLVHRPASATQAPLVVNYTVGGSAVEGVNFASGSLSGTVTIPAGQDTATVSVVPLLEASNTSDTSVVFSLSEGAYYMGTSSSATVTIQNYGFPEDKNCWIGSGNASVAGNWSQGVPVADSDILLSIFSSGDMTWDAGANGLPDTVQSWTQDADYTGTVTFPINYETVSGATFTNFTVTGNAVINGGKWTHPLNTTSTPTYRMAASVGGNFTLGTSASIDVSLKGYNKNIFHSGSALGVHGGACGDLAKVYDSPNQPFYPGSGGGTHAGGGAVWIACDGAVVVNGTIKADSVQDAGAWNGVSSGAGGSVYIMSDSISGAGMISAKSSPISRNAAASGGRIALETTVANSIALPVANLSAVGSSGIYGGSGGTVVTKTAAQQYGTLRIANVGRNSTYGITYPSQSVTTPVVGTWTFDAIAFSASGILSVPTGSTLVLPNGFASVSGVNKTSGILYYGGVIDPQGASPYTFSSNWVFQAYTPYVVTGNVQVVDNGAIGCLQLDNNSTASWPKCDFTVIGNMSVSANSWIFGRASGFDFTAPGGDMTSHGGQQGSSTTIAYGSILNPVMPGSYGYGGDGAKRAAGGGAIMLTVSGNLSLDGTAESSGYYSTNPDWDARGGPGGSLNITAGTLTGTGTISAPGTRGSYNTGSGTGWGHSGGGRVAVRLTESNATFDAFGVSDISAKGGSIATLSWTNNFSSAGTVYLQAGGEAEGAGRIIIRNDNNPNNVCPVTAFPSQKHGGLSDNFKNASLSIEDCAIVKLSSDVIPMVALEMQAGTHLDLNGYTLKVKQCVLGGVPLGMGVYTAAGLQAMLGNTLVKDSSLALAGLLNVSGNSTLIIIR